MEKLYKIEKPDLSKIRYDDPVVTFFDFSEVIQKSESPKYLHWKELKYKNWLPKEIKKEEVWAEIKHHRKTFSKKTPIQDKDGNFFTWQKLGHFEQMFHEIDLDMSKYLLNFPDISKADREKYQLSGITEEAIASSQLEGAHTTRKAAKQMITEKRDPKTHGEKMIFNNFITMKSIQEKFKDEKLSLELLFEMHQMLTSQTLKESEQAQFRSDLDNIVVMKGDDPTIISYVAPPVEFVKKEIKKFIAFANDELESESFIHPVVKAIMLHFWIGLLHPFIDGNGRLARGIFYWYLLRKGYWAFAFLPISIAIKSAPSDYSDAYVCSEQDDNDLTYFIDYHIRKINQAIENFKKYIKQKTLEKQNIEKILLTYKNLNKRQIDTLASFRDNPNRLLNFTTYKNIFEITKATASKDLKTLLDLGFVNARKQGRNIFYTPTKKIEEIF